MNKLKRSLPLTLALTAALSLSTFALPAPAAASRSHLSLTLGGHFEIAGVFFSLFFGRPDRGYPSGYYYRTKAAIPAHGNRCSSACFLRDGYNYHHDSCALVHAQFDRWGYDPNDAIVRYFPAHGQRGGGYGAYPEEGYGYDRSDRYDRGSRYDRDDRDDRSYRSRSRDRHHRHHHDHGRCPYGR